MKQVIKDLKSIVRKYKTSLELNAIFKFSDNDLESLRKAIKYLELIDGLSDNYKGDRHD